MTGSLADALNWAGISEDAFNESLAKCNNEAEREKLIRETLNGLYSKTASEYEKNNKNVLAQREAQAKLAETTARLGEALAPVQTALTELANKALSAITPYIEKFAQDYLPKIQEVLSVVGEKLGEALNYIKEHKEILAVLAGIIGGIVVAIGLYNTVAAIKTAMDAAQVTTVWGLVAAHIAQAAAAMAAIAPYLLIVAAIAAVIAIIVLCVKHWDEIVAAVKQAWENIKKFVAEGVQKVIDFFTNLWDSIVSGLQAAWNWITGILNGAVNWVYNTVVAPIANFFTGMWDGLKNGAKAAWEGIKGVFGGVANWFKNIFSNAWNAVKKVFSTGGKIFSGIKDGIVAAFKTVVNAIINGINRVIAIPFNTINGILNWIKDITIVGIKPFDGLWKRNPLAVPQIPLLAKGGIVDGATLAMIGEQGKEAVVPLENNTEWLDKLAVMLNNRMGGNGRPIVLQVDGKTFAQISVDSINNLTRQSGSLPLVIA